MGKVGTASLNHYRTEHSWVLRLPPAQEFERSNRSLEQPARLHAAKLDDGLALSVNGFGWLIAAWRVADLICLDELAQAKVTVHVKLADTLIGRTHLIELDAEYLDEIEHHWAWDEECGVDEFLLSEFAPVIKSRNAFEISLCPKPLATAEQPAFTRIFNQCAPRCRSR